MTILPVDLVKSDLFLFTLSHLSDVIFYWKIRNFVPFDRRFSHYM